MALHSELYPIPNGAEWTIIDNTTTSFNIQNTAEVMMEYTFTIPIDKGGYLTPYTFLDNLTQPIYVRFYNVHQNGTIHVIRRD